MSRLNNVANRQLLLAAILTTRAATKSFTLLRTALGIRHGEVLKRTVNLVASEDAWVLDDGGLTKVLTEIMDKCSGGVLVDPSDMAAMFNNEEHPGFPRAEWRMHVTDGHTDLGYWDWATQMLHKEYE